MGYEVKGTGWGKWFSIDVKWPTVSSEPIRVQYNVSRRKVSLYLFSCCTQIDLLVICTLPCREQITALFIFTSLLAA